jgi:hypothetical protein
MASPHGLTPGWALAWDRALGVPADSRRARMGQAKSRQRALDGANFFAETIP